PRLMARLVGGGFRGWDRGRRSLGEAGRDVGEDPEERAPSCVSRRDCRSPAAVPEFGDVKNEHTRIPHTDPGRRAKRPRLPSNANGYTATDLPCSIIACENHGSDPQRCRLPASFSRLRECETSILPRMVNISS